MAKKGSSRKPSVTAEMLASKVSDDDIDKSFQAIFGMNARAADKGVMVVMGSTVEALAEYIHDHWMGGSGGERRLKAVERAILEALGRIAGGRDEG